MQPPEQIETARLTLRPFGPDDLDDLYAYQSRPDVCRYLHGEPRDHAQVRAALEQQCRETRLDADAIGTAALPANVPLIAQRTERCLARRMGGASVAGLPSKYARL